MGAANECGERAVWPASDGRELKGRLSVPARPSAAGLPAALVLGSARALEVLTKRLATDGFCALAPDGAEDSEQQDDRAALADLEAALAHLEARADVDAERLAVVGLGRHGTRAFQLACTSRRVAAAVNVAGPVLYPELSAARPSQPLELALNLSCPLLAIFAEADPATPGEQVALLERSLAQWMKSFELLRLEQAGADFLDPASPGYHAHSTAAVVERIPRFLRESLELP